MTPLWTNNEINQILNKESKVINLTSKDVITELLVLGDVAKSLGEFHLANVCWDAAWHIMALHTHAMESSGIALKLECSTRNGYRGKYYDLAVIECQGHSLCIPVPLLTPEVACGFIKLCECVNRVNHERETFDSGEGEVSRLTELIKSATKDAEAVTGWPFSWRSRVNKN